MPSSELIISWISAIVAVITAVVMAIKAFRTSPGERADVAEKYEQMAERQAGQISRLKDRIDEAEAIISDMERKLDSVELKLAEWQHGIALLIHQLESRGDQPIWKPRDTGDLKK